MARTGHADAHAGEMQCMHCFFAKRPATSGILFTTVKAVSDVSRRFSKTASSAAGGGLRFASEHAASQARQPTQRVVSTSTPGEPACASAPPAADAPAAPAAATPAPTAVTLKNPLRP